MSIPIRLPLGERKITPKREDTSRKEKEAPMKRGGDGWDDGETGEDMPVHPTGDLREKRPKERTEKKSAKIDSREGLERDLAMLLGGRRQKYAADMMYDEDAPWRETGPGHYSPIGGHGAQTYSEQFTEPEDASMATNAEEAALLRERDRLDPYGNPTRKMQVQDAAQKRILSEYLGRRGRR